MPIKLLMIGDNSAGKTCALASLASAGYNVRIANLDNGVDALKNILQGDKSKYAKDSLQRLRYRTLTERMRSLQGRIMPASATVWQKTVELLDNFRDDRAFPSAEGYDKSFEEEKLGGVHKWTERDVFVLDTLSTLGMSAKYFYLSINGKLTEIRSGYDAQRDIGQAQDYVDTFLQLMFDANVKCHVILNTHIVYAKEDGSMPKQGSDEPVYGFPAAIGKALSPKMGKYFNNIFYIKRVGTGPGTIYTSTIGNIRLKNGAPLNLKPSYPAETGLADIFRDYGIKPGADAPQQDSAKAG